MASARRLISKRVANALHFRKVLKNEGFEVSTKGPSVKMSFGFWASFGSKWAKKALVQGE